ncbi:hypothetical protein AAMO2058_001687600 [Amorphochlora amoebiformis]
MHPPPFPPVSADEAGRRPRRNSVRRRESASSMASAKRCLWVLYALAAFPIGTGGVVSVDLLCVNRVSDDGTSSRANFPFNSNFVVGASFAITCTTGTQCVTGNVWGCATEQGGQVSAHSSHVAWDKTITQVLKSDISDTTPRCTRNGVTSNTRLASFPTSFAVKPAQEISCRTNFIWLVPFRGFSINTPFLPSTHTNRTLVRCRDAETCFRNVYGCARSTSGDASQGDFVLGTSDVCTAGKQMGVPSGDYFQVSTLGGNGEGIRTKKGCSGSGVVSLDVTRSPYSSPTTAPTPFSRILTFKIETVAPLIMKIGLDVMSLRSVMMPGCPSIGIDKISHGHLNLNIAKFNQHSFIKVFHMKSNLILSTHTQ